MRIVETANGDRTTTVADRMSLRRMIRIWTLSVAPMVVLGWIVAPLIGDSIHDEEGLVRAGLLTLGLAWLFVYALILVRQEEGDLSWATVKHRLRLNPPISPQTGERGGRLWWWVVLLVVLFAAYNLLIHGLINDAVSSLVPAISEPDRYSLDSLLESDERLEALEGAWWIVILFTALGFFNIFGEEFIFRGVLLPEMPEIFARWPWVANGIIFGLYHLHQPWGIPGAMIDGAFLLALPAWYFRSTTVALIVHGSQSIFFIFIVLGVVLGVA